MPRQPPIDGHRRHNGTGTLLLGVTATPDRGDGVGLDDIFTEIVFKRTLPQMVQRDICRTCGRSKCVRRGLRIPHVSHGDFRDSEAGHAVMEGHAPELAAHGPTAARQGSPFARIHTDRGSRPRDRLTHFARKVYTPKRWTEPRRPISVAPFSTGSVPARRLPWRTVRCRPRVTTKLNRLHRPGEAHPQSECLCADGWQGTRRHPERRTVSSSTWSAAPRATISSP